MIKYTGASVFFVWLAGCAPTASWTWRNNISSVLLISYMYMCTSNMEILIHIISMFLFCFSISLLRSTDSLPKSESLRFMFVVFLYLPIWLFIFLNTFEGVSYSYNRSLVLFDALTGASALSLIFTDRRPFETLMLYVITIFLCHLNGTIFTLCAFVTMYYTLATSLSTLKEQAGAAECLEIEREETLAGVASAFVAYWTLVYDMNLASY